MARSRSKLNHFRRFQLLIVQLGELSPEQEAASKMINIEVQQQHSNAAVVHVSLDASLHRAPCIHPLQSPFGVSAAWERWLVP